MRYIAGIGTRFRALPPVVQEFVYPTYATGFNPACCEPCQCVPVLWFSPIHRRHKSPYKYSLCRFFGIFLGIIPNFSRYVSKQCVNVDKIMFSFRGVIT